MLVLTRKEGEAIRFLLTEPLPAGTQFRIVVRNLQRGQVRLATDAPQNVNITREEITPVVTEEGDHHVRL